MSIRESWRNNREHLQTRQGRSGNVKQLLALLKPYRRRVALMFVALLLATAAALAPPPLAKMAIDGGIIPGNKTNLVWITVAFLASGLILWAATYLQTYLVNWVGQRALQDLRVRLFRHLQSLPVGFYERRQTGVLISRMTNDVQALDSLVTDSIVTLFQASLTLIGSVAILFFLDVQLALLTLAIVPILLVGSLAFRIASATAYTKTRETIGAITAALQEILSGIRVVRSFGQEPRHLNELNKFNENNRDANMKTVYLNAVYFPSVEFINAVATVIVLLYGGSQAIAGNVSIGVLVGFIAALNTFFDPIQQLSQLYTTYQAGMAALDKIFELLKEKPAMQDAETAAELPRPLTGAIEFQKVSFHYGDVSEHSPNQQFALNDISLKIAAGETIAIVGETGAGKSTFIKLVARFYDPTAGTVLVDNHDLRTVKMQSLRSQLGIVPQESFLFSGTIRENVAFAVDAPPEEDVLDALKRAGASALIASLPEGIETEVGERGIQLSAGQRQLIAIARALLGDPRILILDEATANVDLHTEQAIVSGLGELLDDRTAIVIAHRLSTIRSANRIVVIEHGKIIEQGTHDELLQRDGAYHKLYCDWVRDGTTIVPEGQES